MPPAGPATLYRRLWRWHFYASLFVIPFILVLALSGALYLFKPQVDRWEERAFRGLSATEAVAPSAQARAALQANPGSRLHSYRLPEAPGDAALVHLALAEPGRMRDVFVSPQGEVVGSLDADTRIMAVVRSLHSGLLMGERGSRLVELAACWAIVMILTGLYLWWPRGRGAAGVLWPRRRSLLRDLHAVTGFWVAALAFVLLLTGLPWTGVWGSAFTALREQMGWVNGPQPWIADAAHGHDHAAMHEDSVHADPLPLLDALLARAREESIEPPVRLLTPGAAQFGGAFSSPDWTLKSDTQNLPLGLSISYDAATGSESRREPFAAGHPIDQVVGYGIAWHEGQLFGVLNQLIGLLTALALIMLAVTGFLMWRRRRPTGQLGAPPLTGATRKPALVMTLILVLAALLPLLAASLVVLWVVDLMLPRLSPAAARWLGMTR